MLWLSRSSLPASSFNISTGKLRNQRGCRPLSDLIGGLESDAVDIPGQAVRMGLHFINGTLAIGLIRTARLVLTPFECRNTMILRMTFCSAQASLIFCRRFGSMPLPPVRDHDVRIVSCSANPGSAVAQG